MHRARIADAPESQKGKAVHSSTDATEEPLWWMIQTAQAQLTWTVVPAQTTLRGTHMGHVYVRLDGPAMTANPTVVSATLFAVECALDLPHTIAPTARPTTPTPS